MPAEIRSREKAIRWPHYGGADSNEWDLRECSSFCFAALVILLTFNATSGVGPTPARRRRPLSAIRTSSHTTRY